MGAEARLAELGLTLPAPPAAPPGMEIPFAWARVHRQRVYVSGHGALDAQGRPAGPFGRVPDEVDLTAAQESARGATLAMLASLRAALGDLDRIEAWLTVRGFVNVEPGYDRTTVVLNPASDLILSVFGPGIGAHARTAIGAPAVPLNLPVIIAAELAIG